MRILKFLIISFSTLNNFKRFFKRLKTFYFSRLNAPLHIVHVAMSNLWMSPIIMVFYISLDFWDMLYYHISRSGSHSILSHHITLLNIFLYTVRQKSHIFSALILCIVPALVHDIHLHYFIVLQMYHIST